MDKYSLFNTSDYSNQVEPYTWITASGKKVLVTEMESSHVVNSMNMLIRNKKFTPIHTNYWVKIFKEELKRRDPLSKSIN